MLKLIVTASALAIAAPALAQAAQDQPQTTPKTAAPAPTTATAPAQDSTLTPTADPAAAQPAAPAGQADPATTAAAQPAAGDAVAQVVDTGWSTYDTNSDGKLSFTEFSAWMNKVKADSDPKLKPDAPATKAWNRGAFAQADADKSKSVSKEELTAFLSKGQKAS